MTGSQGRPDRLALLDFRERLAPKENPGVPAALAPRAPNAASG